MNRFDSFPKRLKWLAPFLLTAFIGGCGGGSQDPILGTGDIAKIPPTVTSVTPANSTTGVAISNPVISATFSEAMSPITGAASFTLTCASPCVSPVGAVALDATSRTAKFTLAAGTTLAPLTLYTATVTGASSIASGLAIARPYTWSFITGAAPDSGRPTVILTNPATTVSGTTSGVATTAAISVVFSEDMAPTSITTAGFLVSCAAPCVSPTGSVHYLVSNRTVTFTPAAKLAANTTYTVTITTAATDIAGNALAGNQAALPAASNYVWTFTTATAPTASDVAIQSTDPVAGAGGICPDATINVTFGVPSNMRMDPASVNAMTFTVKSLTSEVPPAIAGTISLDAATGLKAKFTPLAPLTAGVGYTASIKGGIDGVKDLAAPANTLPINYSWTFVAGSCTVGGGLFPLGSASTFGTFGGSAGVTNQGILTVINGDIGTTAVSTAVTGFHDTDPLCTYTETGSNVGTVNGKIYTSAPPPTVGCPSEGTAVTAGIASLARNDALIAYNALAAKAGGPDPGAGNLANLVLVPGVYTAAAGSFMIQGGDLTLDAQGDANATWVFQMATTLTVGGPGAAAPQSVTLINGALAKNVFWQVGSAATINAGGGGTMAGTIISQAGAAFSTPGNVSVVTLNGRVLSLGASVTLVNTVINVPSP